MRQSAGISTINNDFPGEDINHTAIKTSFPYKRNQYVFLVLFEFGQEIVIFCHTKHFGWNCLSGYLKSPLTKLSFYLEYYVSISTILQKTLNIIFAPIWKNKNT